MLTKSQLLDLYYWLQLNRILEDRLVSLYRSGKIAGSVYASRGQEAISVGVAYALEKVDIIAPMYRNLGSLLVRGILPEEILAHYLGRRTGPTQGKDCHQNIGDLRRGIVAPLDIFGALIPVVAGVALALKMQMRSSIALTFIGDGGSSTTDFHEGLNFAAVQKVPMILVVENNGWAFSTPTEKQTANPAFITRASAYGVGGMEVDGNDVIGVYEATAKARSQVQAGSGPILIEAKTMRMRGFAEDDSGWYMPKEQIQAWKAKDPIRRFENYLFQNGLMTESDRQAITRRVLHEVDNATKKADRSPWPLATEALEGVYYKAVASPDRARTK